MNDPVAALLTRDEKGELAVVRNIRKWMDELIKVPGTKFSFGLDSLIGLIPVIGDAAGSVVGAFMLHAANRLGVPTIVMVRMLFNLLIDAIIGVIPVVGDSLDFMFKAHAKNAKLIEDSILDRGATARGSWLRLTVALTVFGTIVAGGIIGTIFLAKWAWQAAG